MRRTGPRWRTSSATTRSSSKSCSRKSIASVIERHVQDERLRTALHGQGLIGTWAGPRDPGTAAIHAMHSMGTIEGREGAWGYVQGGMGRVSFALAAAAEEAGAVIRRNAPVAEIVPGEAVVLEDGTRLGARTVISNADPRATLGLLSDAAPPAFADRVRAWRMEGPVLKINCALSRLPTFTAAGADDAPAPRHGDHRAKSRPRPRPHTNAAAPVSPRRAGPSCISTPHTTRRSHPRAAM